LNKPKSKAGGKSKDDNSSFAATRDSLVQSKLVLLTLHFPNLRIIWSPSPHASAEIFRDLKLNSPEPEIAEAVSLGADVDNLGEVNPLAEDLLRSLPGVTQRGLRTVMTKVRSVGELCEMSLTEIQEILGEEDGKKCYEFIHHGETTKAGRNLAQI
jgi:DNA excision repair protein ERCC-4